MNKRLEDTQRRLLIAAAVVLAVIGSWAAYIVGTPGYNRSLLQDRETIDRLQCLACGVQEHYCTHKRLPNGKDEAFDALFVSDKYWCSAYRCNQNDLQSVKAEAFKDQRYERRDGEDYAVCGHFLQDSKAQELQRRSWQKPVREFSEYPAGNHCFTLKVKPCKKGGGS